MWHAYFTRRWHAWLTRAYYFTLCLKCCPLLDCFMLREAYNEREKEREMVAAPGQVLCSSGSIWTHDDSTAEPLNEKIKRKIITNVRVKVLPDSFFSHMYMCIEVSIWWTVRHSIGCFREKLTMKTFLKISTIKFLIICEKYPNNWLISCNILRFLINFTRF